MNLLSTAREVYEAIKDDEKIIADLRAERKSLAKSMMTDASFSTQITSASVNGQSFSKTHNITNGQRLQMLGLVIRMADLGYKISSKSTPIF